MKKITLLGLLAILAIAVEGCTIGSNNKEATTPKPSTTTTSKTPNQSKKAEKEQNATRPQRVSGLIPATNPDVRVSGSARGRQDPFALVRVTPEIKKLENESRFSGRGNSRTGNNISQNITGVPTIDSLDNGDYNDGLDDNSLDDRANNDGLDDLATNSELILAEQVLITGIVKLGGITKVIVKAPGEAYTRHVNIGEYVSNGRVLVKRVEGLNSAAPKVILQQKGVEIRKAVGEKPTIENGPTAQVVKELHSQLTTTLNLISSFPLIEIKG